MAIDFINPNETASNPEEFNEYKSRLTGFK